MAIEALVALVPPPERIPSRGERSERSSAGQLPADYWSLVERYGVGSFDDFVWVLVPDAVNPHLNYDSRSTELLDALREVQRLGEEVPFDLTPGHEEILPWAFTDNGDVLYWITRDSVPERWTVVVNEGRSGEWEEIQASCTDALVLLLSARQRLTFFPHDFPSQEPRFVPVPER